MGHIYLIRNTLNGKGYVGKTEKTIARRFSQHEEWARRGSSFPIHRAMRKYGVENFMVTEIVSFESDFLNDLETGFIGIYGTFAPGGYNLTLGGDGRSGYTHGQSPSRVRSPCIWPSK